MSLEPTKTILDQELTGNTEQQRIAFLLELTERLTIDGLQSVGQFALNYLIHLTGATAGSLRLISTAGGDRHIAPDTHEITVSLTATREEWIVAEWDRELEQQFFSNHSIFWQALETGEPTLLEGQDSTYFLPTNHFRGSGISVGIFPIRAMNQTLIGGLTLKVSGARNIREIPNYDMVVATCRVMGAILLQRIAYGHSTTLTAHQTITATDSPSRQPVTTLAETELGQQELRSRLFADITLKIRQSLQLDDILQTTVTEVRKLLLADRVLIYCLSPDATGRVLTDATVPGVASLIGSQFSPEVFPPEFHSLYREGRIRAISDIETAGLTPCHVHFLQGLQIKAKLVVPLLQGTELWGLMIAHQCNTPRPWTTFEIDLLQQLANQVSIALSQAQLLQALRESEERFRQLTENIQEVFWMRDPHRSHKSLVYVSPTYQHIWGRSCASLYENAHSWQAAIHPDDRERIILAFQQIPTSSYDEEYRIVRPDGSLRWIRDRAFPVKDHDGNLHRIAGIAEDITERKHQEQRLRLLESVVVHANDAVVVTTAEPLESPGPHIVYVNKAFERMTGYSAAEVLGKNPRLLQGPKTDRATLAKIRQALKAHQSIVVELVNYRKDGSDFWSEISIMPVTDCNGHYTHRVAIQRDVTCRKQLEEELLKALGKEKELNELKSRFIAMTSHEFRTPLSTILSASELLEYYGHLWSETERLEQLRLIQDTVQHMTQLLEDTLLLGRSEANQLEFHSVPVNLIQFCQELVAQIKLSVGKNHPITLMTRHSNLMAWVDKKLLRQILTNLLSNAAKYSPQGCPIQLEIDHTGNRLVFRVADQGIGIPPEDHHHLFEAFHRAKNVGVTPGTGLGLAIVKRCVDAHHGHISFTTEVGNGTTFEVELPVVDNQESQI